MKFCALVLFVSAAVAQQQDVAVRLASPGFFTGGNSNSQLSSFVQNNNDGRLQSFNTLGQNTFQNSPSVSNNQQFSSFNSQGLTSFNNNQRQSFNNNQDQSRIRVNLFSSNDQPQQALNVPSTPISLGRNNFLQNFASQQTFSNQQNNQNNNLRNVNTFSQSTFRTSPQVFNNFESTEENGVFEPLNLPSGATLRLGNIQTGFNCANRPYGYFADTDNACRVFHVCNPTVYADGRVETYQYSFMCGEGSVFDQDRLTCVSEADAISCSESSNYFYRNEQFGLPNERI